MGVIYITLALFFGFIVTLALSVAWVFQLSKKQAEFNLNTRNTEDE